MFLNHEFTENTEKAMNRLSLSVLSVSSVVNNGSRQLLYYVFCKFLLRFRSLVRNTGAILILILILILWFRQQELP